jgi:integrase
MWAGPRGAEVDFEKKVWTIPASRMKAGPPHRAPVAERSVEILERARELAGTSDYVFPGRSTRRPFSNMVFLMALRRMRIEATAHGFRSSFRDWAAERTNVPREVAEMALAHMVKDKVEAAYRRGDLFEKRRIFMEQWATSVASKPGDVLTWRGRSRPLS